MTPQDVAQALVTGAKVDLTAMDGILDLDTNSAIVRVQAGATWGALEAALSRRALTLGPLLDGLRDEAIATTWAENALRRPSARYGQLTDAIIAVRAALPDGRLTHASVSPKRAVGPDLPRCTLGAGFAGGVVCEVHVQAWPRARQAHWIAARFDEWAPALGGVVRTLRAGVPSAWLEINRSAGAIQVSARVDCHTDEQAHRFAQALGGTPCDGAQADYEAATRSYTHALRCVDAGPHAQMAKAADATRGGRIMAVEPHRARLYARSGASPVADDWQALATTVFDALKEPR
ncbi:MAG: FAD/FMN-containing dehydrogenase [Bradymonadia bacterium]|jgi:FAD/FMN-containing dehydrogenase